MLTDIHIENFRGFADLKLEGLKRVNLVVGKNNAGKTSFLEAVVVGLNPPNTIGTLPGQFRESPKAVQHKFFPWLIRDTRPHAVISINDGAGHVILSRNQFDPKPVRKRIGYNSFAGGGALITWAVGGLGVTTRTRSLSVAALSPEEMIDTFAEAIRSPESERQLEDLLRSIDKRIRTIRLDYANGNPFIVVDVGLKERIPLSQAGQGIYRLVSIFSEILGQKPQVLFIDEIENGIHYTALPQVWQGIAEAAERLDVQIFATTHSGECLKAAHEIFSQRESYGLSVIQLYALDDRTDGRVLDQQHIAAALAGDIELR